MKKALSAPRNRKISKRSVMYGPKDQGKEDHFLVKRRKRLIVQLERLRIKEFNLRMQTQRVIRKLDDTEKRLKQKGSLE